MDTRLSVDVLAPGALGAPELAAWREFQDASPRFASPYFAPDYALAADGIVPGAAVAVIHRGGALEGFLPFQRRGAYIQPLAAPLTDYHGPIMRPDAETDLVAVLRGLGASAYAFSGLRADRVPNGDRAFAHSCMVADVRGGANAYLAARPRTKRFFKDKERRARALAAELGPLDFRFEDETDAFDFVLAQKRAQYARTGRHDIFACGWTERFLRRLWETRTPVFGGRFTTLRAGGRLVSAEYGLRGGAVRHLWFPAFDPALSRFGPGTTLMNAAIRAAADDPKLDAVDFGAADSAYKAMYAEPNGVMYEGAVRADALHQASARVADLAAAGVPALRAVRDRLRRRFAIIRACETTAAGFMGGALLAFRHAARRNEAAA